MDNRQGGAVFPTYRLVRKTGFVRGARTTRWAAGCGSETLVYSQFQNALGVLRARVRFRLSDTTQTAGCAANRASPCVGIMMAEQMAAFTTVCPNYIANGHLSPDSSNFQSFTACEPLRPVLKTLVRQQESLEKTLGRLRAARVRLCLPDDNKCPKNGRDHRNGRLFWYPAGYPRLRSRCSARSIAATCDSKFRPQRSHCP